MPEVSHVYSNIANYKGATPAGVVCFLDDHFL